MISINILLPHEKKCIKEEVTKFLRKRYNMSVKKFKFNHIGDERVYLYVTLEDGTLLYLTAGFYKKCIYDITVSEDMSL